MYLRLRLSSRLRQPIYLLNSLCCPGFRTIVTTFASEEKSLSPADGQQAIDRLLALKSTTAKVSYKLLPPPSASTLDLLSNPRLCQLVIPIDPRLIAPFYRDADHHNSRLQFFQTGNMNQDDIGFYVRSFMPFCRPSAPDDTTVYIKPPNDGFRPWEPLAKLLLDVFNPIGVTEMRDFYTHVHPPWVGRISTHKDRLQSGTWKVDIRFSAGWTTLLVLDEEDRQWYALRFPPGGSGFVIDSEIFSRFHAVRAGAHAQQSVLAVFNKQGSNHRMVRDALAKMASGAAPLETDYLLKLKEIGVPLTSETHPRSLAATQANDMRTKHLNHCLQLLDQSVWAVDPQEALKHKKGPSERGLLLGRVSRSVVDTAITALPSSVQGDVRNAYEKNVKLMQQSSYGLPPKTKAHKISSIEAGKKNRVVLDDRFIAIRGTTVLSTGEKCHFRDYDGSEDRLIRVALERGDNYSVTVTTDSANDNIRNLALLARDLNFRARSPTTFSVRLVVVDGNVIIGERATQLRDRGLDMRVVTIPGEPDYKSKRARELERRKSNALHRSTKPALDSRPKRPLSALQFYMQARSLPELRLVRGSFDALTAHEKKVYEDQADADRRRFDTEMAEWRSSKPQTSYKIYCSEMGATLAQQHPEKYSGQEGQAALANDLKSQWLQLGPKGWLEYERKEIQSGNQQQAVQTQHAYLGRCLNLLRKAVAKVDPTEASRVRGRSWLTRVNPSVIDIALATLPPGLQGDARKAFEDYAKAVQAGKNRVVLDDRFIAIRGTATLSSGEQCGFRDYDGTEDTLIRFALLQGDNYSVNVSIGNRNDNIRNLALLAKHLNFPTWSSTQYSVTIGVVDGNVITGQRATLLRDRGLDMRVVTIPGELDYKSKRVRELQRRKSLSLHHVTKPLNPDQSSVRKHRVVLDYRLIAISGTATLSSGEQCHFRDYDGTENTLLRVALKRGNNYCVDVSTASSNDNIRNLALLAKDLNFRGARSSTQYSISFSIVDGDVITGGRAALFRGRGLDMRVVTIPGEPDYQSRRAQELARRASRMW